MTLQSFEFAVNLTSPMPCLVDCESLLELGPPPDLITGMPPPPPIPSFLRDPVEMLSAANGSCNLCGWATGSEDVQLVEVTRKYPVIDDMWYFVIVSAAVGAVLFGVLIVIATLRCKEAKVKPLHDTCSKLQKVHTGGATVDSSGVSPQAPPPLSIGLPPSGGPKALWSGLKHPGDNPAYALHHQAINPELLSNYERVDYGSVGHTRPPISAPAAAACYKMASRMPPPLPLNPPPTICPSYCTAQSDGRGVHIMGNGNAYYANPDSLDGSFENSGYVDSECSMEVRRVAPDGAVVARKGRTCLTPVRGGGWEEAYVRQRFEMAAAANPMAPHSISTDSHYSEVKPIESSSICRGDRFKSRIGYAIAQQQSIPRIGGAHHKVSSPLV